MERLTVAWQGKDQSCGEGLDQYFECVGLIWSPNKQNTFLGKVEQGVCDAGEIPYKVSVKVTETQEGLNMFDGSRNWPSYNASYFGRVHLDLSF